MQAPCRCGSESIRQQLVPSCRLPHEHQGFQTQRAVQELTSHRKKASGHARGEVGSLRHAAAAGLVLCCWHRGRKATSHSTPTVRASSSRAVFCGTADQRQKERESSSYASGLAQRNASRTPGSGQSKKKKKARKKGQKPSFGIYNLLAAYDERHKGSRPFQCEGCGAWKFGPELWDTNTEGDEQPSDGDISPLSEGSEWKTAPAFMFGGKYVCSRCWESERDPNRWILPDSIPQDLRLQEAFCDVAERGTRASFVILCVRATDLASTMGLIFSLRDYVNNAPIMAVVTQLDHLPDWPKNPDVQLKMRAVQRLADDMIQIPLWRGLIQVMPVYFGDGSTGKKGADVGMEELVAYVKKEAAGRNVMIMGSPNSGKSTLAAKLLVHMAKSEGDSSDVEEAEMRADRLTKLPTLHSTLAPMRLKFAEGTRQVIYDTPAVWSRCAPLLKLGDRTANDLLRATPTTVADRVKLSPGQSWVLSLKAKASPTGEALPLMRVDVEEADSAVFFGHAMTESQRKIMEYVVVDTESAPPAVQQEPFAYEDDASSASSDDDAGLLDDSSEASSEDSEGDEESLNLYWTPRFSEARPMSMDFVTKEYVMDLSAQGFGTVHCRSIKAAKIRVAQLNGMRAEDTTIPIVDISDNSEEYAEEMEEGYKLWPPEFLGLDRGFGVVDDYENEVRQILIKYNLEDLLYDKNDAAQAILEEADDVLARVQETLPEELKQRVDSGGDFRNERVFTIDPATARDLDDAIHVKRVDGGKVAEIGVHIADVTHYLRSGTIMDDEARSRSTTVYYPDRVMPMLPRVLCDDVCSLHAGPPKLTFSAIFRINVADGTLVKDPAPYFKKSVIQSCCRFSYEEAQDVLDGKDIAPLKVLHGHKWDGLVSDLHLLYDVCGKVRKLRFKEGAIEMERSSMSLLMEEGRLMGYQIEDDSASSPSHWLIEELMLMANKVVAEYLKESPLGPVSVLRVHPPPKADLLQEMQARLAPLKVKIKDDSTKSLKKGLQSMKGNEAAKAALTTLICVSMISPAQYRTPLDDPKATIKKNEKIVKFLGHWALGFTTYTHFTSPIRRYADVMVHRQLKSVLDGTDGELWFAEKEEIWNQCKQCNTKSRSADFSEREVKRAFIALWMKHQGQHQEAEGVVVAIDRSSLEVVLPDLDLLVSVDYTQTFHTKEYYPSADGKEIPLPKAYKAGGLVKMDDDYEGKPTRQRQGIELWWLNDGEEPDEIKPFSSVNVLIAPLKTEPIQLGVFLQPSAESEYWRRDVKGKKVLEVLDDQMSTDVGSESSLSADETEDKPVSKAKPRAKAKAKAKSKPKPKAKAKAKARAKASR